MMLPGSGGDMTDAATGGEAAAPSPKGGAAGALGRLTSFVRENVKETLITGLIAFAVGWFINVYVVAVRYEGTGVGSGGTATVGSNWLTGSLFWLILAAVVTTLISYGRRVGVARLGRELTVLPQNLVRGFGGGSQAWAMLLFGAALSLVVAILFGTAAAGASGFALLVVAASPIVAKLGQLIRNLGMRLLTMAAGDDARKLSSASSLTSVLGAAVGMAVAWQVPSVWAKLVLAAVAVGLSVVLVRGGDAQSAVTLILGVLAGLALRELFHGVAMADDGGWQEGGGTLGSWWGSQGSGTVMANSTVAGGMATAGSVAGTAAGQVMASTVSDAGLGGLSGEWGAQDAGVEAVPSAPQPSAVDGGPGVVAPPVTGDEQVAPSGGPPAPPDADPGGPASTDTPSGAPSDTPPGTSSDTPPGTQSDDASLGGLSGQWTGDTPPSGPPPAAPPGPADGAASPGMKPPLPPAADDDEAGP